MTVNLIKLCVGIEDVDHLIESNARRLEEKRLNGIMPELIHVTRNFPKRGSEILSGGSLYWVIKGYIRARQPVVQFKEHTREDGKIYCGIVLSPELVRTELRAFRPFQGWRYLETSSTPRDVSDQNSEILELPDQMAEELKGLGLI